MDNNFSDLSSLKNLNYKFIIPVAVVALFLIFGTGYYFLHQKSQPSNNPQDAQKQSQEETQRLVAEIGKLIELPTGEVPTVATVSDVSKLKNQPFFQNASNGDKVLIYSNAKKAILYSPTLKKVLEVAPINVGT